MRNLKPLLLIICIAFLSACTATPDLSSFAEESKHLRLSVSETQQDILFKVSDLSKQMNKGKSQGWVGATGKSYEVMTDDQVKDFQSQSRQIESHISTIDATMAALVAYSDAIANLAAAGETGKESVESLQTSVKSIANTLSLAYPPAAVAYDGFKTLIEEVADIYTRIEAQESLAEAMSNAQPVVEKLALLIEEQSTLLDRLTVNIANLRIVAIRGSYGAAKIGYYEKFNAYQNMENLYGSILTDCKCGGVSAQQGKTKNYCNESVELKNKGIMECHLLREEALSSRIITLARIKSDYAAYTDASASEFQWATSTKSQLKAISAAAAAWASTHQKATTLLTECGGKHSLRPSCGNLTVDNLKSTAERLKAIQKEF